MVFHRFGLVTISFLRFVNSCTSFSESEKMFGQWLTSERAKAILLVLIAVQKGLFKHKIMVLRHPNFHLGKCRLIEYIALSFAAIEFI